MMPEAVSEPPSSYSEVEGEPPGPDDDAEVHREYRERLREHSKRERAKQ